MRNKKIMVINKKLCYINIWLTVITKMKKYITILAMAMGFATNTFGIDNLGRTNDMLGGTGC